MSVDEGTTFADYRIERRVGSGGMGTVYLAQHPRLSRKDALKILSDSHTGDVGFRARFLREAEIAARLEHPNLVAVRDRGEFDGQLWIAMQYVDGPDLNELIARGPAVLPFDRAMWILAEAARGLDEVHRAGLLHRDVKPANILIAERPGRTDRVLVTDFGIARPADDSETLSGSGGFAATLAYAAPEQLSGEPVDHRADVYALGCTLYQMLTGTVPYPRNSPGSVMYAQLHEPPPRPTLRNPLVPVGFDAVIATAMAKNPADRYPSCGALAAAAQAALAGVAPDDPPRRSRIRRRVLSAVAAVSVLAIAAATALAATRPDDSTASESPRSPVTTGIEPTYWGVYSYIPEAFPDLLPTTPMMAAGYQEMTACAPVAERNGDSLTLDQVVDINRLFCLGNRDPVESVQIMCRADRKPIEPARSFATVEGDEHWSRPSGSGHLFWGNELYFGTGTFLDDKVWGVLEIYFDDPNRNFCRLRVVGAGPSGAGLRERWWADAPI